MSFLDGLDGVYALGCVLAYGIAFTEPGTALRDAHCESNYRLIAKEIERVGRERYENSQR